MSGVPNHLPTGKKTEISKAESHYETVKVSLKCAGEMSVRSTVWAPFVHIRLATHNSRHTTAVDLIEARKVLALPKPQSSVLELYLEHTTTKY